MCKLVSKQNFINVFLTFIAFSSSFIFASINWSGGDITCAQSNIDMSFSISGENTIVGPVLVQANTTNVTVTIGAGAVLKSDDTEKGRIFISATAGNTVTFNVDNDLKFRGSNNNQNPLLIAFSGAGTLVFRLANNTLLSFTSDTTTEGARFYVCMDDVDQPTVRFERQSNNSPTNVEVKVGPKSCVTYVVNSNDTNFEKSNAVGTIEFDPHNADTDGCTILRLENSACFVIEGQEADKQLETCTGPGDAALNFLGFTCADVDLTTLAGLRAQFRVVSTGVSTDLASLRIINQNQLLPPFRVDPFCDNSFNDANGQRWGFVLGANGNVTTEDCTYIDYITTGSPVCPKQCPPADCICGLSPEQVIKERNPSAFFVDGISDESQQAVISMNGSSGIFFRAGADVCGNVNEAGGFVINPGDTLFADVKTPGVGQVVFDVEGKLDVIGESPNSNALQILSLEVFKTNCSIVIASEATDPNKTVFPLRTFFKNNAEEYLRYNSGAFLINNCMTVRDASIVHTDENHNVFERDNLGRSDVHSEPTYEGGEAHKIECQGQTRPRPKIAFENSIFRIHTNAGLTGVDLQVPNVNDEAGNSSVFRFYNNGCSIDKSYGRILILGTSEGSLSCDGSLVDHDSHLDVLQTKVQLPQNADAAHILELQTANNDACIIEDLTTVKGCSVHTIFQGGSSNISVGSNQAVVDAGGLPQPVTFPTILINGSFFSFETAGGSLGFPEASGTTGEGGIFVDKNGSFGIADSIRANFATMVVKSSNGIVNLPKNAVFFDNRIGITKWLVNLANPLDRILVDTNESLSDFTFDWGAAIRDCENFTPYELKDTPSLCQCPPIVSANLTSIPVVKGEVDQLQIKRSRLGDMVHLCVDGGKVRELIMLQGFNTAEAPMGLIAVDNYGQLGIGTAHRNIDSLNATVKLGVNGITLVAKGNGIVELNEDTIIDNVCHIMTGPNFGVAGPQVFTIHSQDEKELRIKSGGCLDLSNFDTPNKILEIAGSVRVVCEPGAQIILGSPLAGGQRGRLVFTDRTTLAFDRILDPSLGDKPAAADLEPILVKISGIGEILFQEAASVLLHQQSFVAVQSHPTCAPQTDIAFILNNQAKFEIGNDAEPGGSLQIGNTTEMEGASVKFELVVDGPGARFEINREGLFGAGAVVSSKRPNLAPNDWTVESARALEKFQITLNEGFFTHNQIYPTTDTLASVFVVGGEAGNAFGFTYSRRNALIRGGGNIFCIPSVLRKTKRNTKSDNMVIIQKESNLPLDHFTMIPAESEHAKAIHIRLEPGASMSGGQGKVRLRLNSKRPLDMNGRELVLLSHYITQMSQQDSTRRLPGKVTRVAPGKKLVLAKQLEFINDAKTDLFITPSDMTVLTSLLVDAHTSSYRLVSTHPVVEDVASAQANLFQSKDMFDQFNPLIGLVSPTDYHTYLSHINTNDYPAPSASIAPFGPTQSRVGFIQSNTEIVRRPITKIINGISGDPTDHQISHTRGAVYHHRHSEIGRSYSFIEIPHLQV